MDRKHDHGVDVDPNLADEFRRELEGESVATDTLGAPYRASGKMHKVACTVTAIESD